MNSPGQTPYRHRSTGPQGTQLFSAEELHQYASETEPTRDGRPSVSDPVLEGVSEGLEGHRFSLRSGRQTVGRGDACDIVVEDPSVSSSHAWVINQHGHYVLMNTLSTNGTFVNDKRVHEAILRHGDHIRLGQARFVFLTREHGAVNGARWGWIAIAVVVLFGLAAFAWWLA